MISGDHRGNIRGLKLNIKLLTKNKDKESNRKLSKKGRIIIVNVPGIMGAW